MKKTLNFYFNTELTRDQCKETGVAMVLVFMILALIFKQDLFIFCAIGAHVFNMTAPQVYRPVAVIWLGLSRVIGKIVSKVILSIVFAVVVTPVGLWRRIFVKDSLKLKDFKAGYESVMHVRNHTFIGENIERPY